MTRLAPGTALGRYEVIAHVGSGGMGDVYRARDKTLDKTVALKTIAAAYAQDPASLSRFERERTLTASLEHPHICRLLDAGREDGIDYLAMEYLDGESLAHRLARGPLPVDHAIGCGVEIAEALDYAHAHGVIHRDLKPANVFLTSTGAKVLDFGLAKLRPPGAAASLAGKTAPLDATQAGAVMGSAPYMAPERLEGRDADVRTDVFAFGLLLYEMLTGRRAFDADSPAALIAAILLSEPPPLGLEHPAGTDLDWLVARCLAKKPDARWQSMADVGAVLKRLQGPGFANVTPATSRTRLLPAAAVILAAAVGAVWWAARGPAASAGSPIVFTIEPPPGGAFTPTEGSIQTAQVAVAPDGRSVAFVATHDGVSRVWLRRFDALAATALVGTEDATYPFWSPDGTSLGFFADRLLKRIALAGGPPRTIASAPSGRGGAWGETGEILFAPGATGTLSRVSAGGGQPVEATRLARDRGEASHRWPVFLPGGRRFLYFAQGAVEAHDGLYLGSIDGGNPVFITNTGFGGAFLPPNRVLFLTEETLLARAIDLQRGTPVGEPVVVAEPVGWSSNFYGAFSAASTNVIAYARPASTSDLVWVDRAGAVLRSVSTARNHVDFRLSPDGHALASAEAEAHGGLPDLYVVDLARGTRLRITASQATDGSPVWAPDARRLAYRSNRTGVHDLFVKDTFTTAVEQPFYASASAKYPTSWSPDGQWLAFHTHAGETQWDVARVPTKAGAAPEVLLGSRFNEVQAQFSPGGRWVAYTSDETRRLEVYVQSVDREPRRIRVSVNGGDDPRWRHDGQELFYVSPDGYLMAAAVREQRDTLVVAPTQRLFRVRPGGARTPFLSSYDVASDGRQFLIRQRKDDVRALPLTVLVNPPVVPPQ